MEHYKLDKNYVLSIFIQITSNYNNKLRLFNIFVKLTDKSKNYTLQIDYNEGFILLI